MASELRHFVENGSSTVHPWVAMARGVLKEIHFNT